MHHGAVAGPDVLVVERWAVDGCSLVLEASLVRSHVQRWERKTYVGHDMFTEVSVGVPPCGAVGDDIVGTCCAQLGDHQG